MRLRRPRDLAGKVTAGAAITLLVFFLGSYALFGLGSSSSESFGGDGVSRADLRALTFGSSRDDVEARLGEGPGQDALAFMYTGAALEPRGADCVYFPLAPDGHGVVQLCFRDDRLVRKQAYEEPPG